MKRQCLRRLTTILMVCVMCMCKMSMVFTTASADDSTRIAREETEQMVKEAKNAYFKEMKEELASELRVTSEVIPAESYPTQERAFYVLSHNGREMRFFMEIIGEPGENGLYPLYLTLHGGGGGPTEGNNDQWIDMLHYYKEAVESGIYIACRGITDTWDLHFQKESYPLYDRLIQAMVLNYGADPDRVYLLGFSAGGDGVYQVAPRLADRFAAVSMSAGHPNGVSLLNLQNCPIILQAGIRDYYSEDGKRSVRAAEADEVLDSYRETYGGGYEHEVFIHVPAGHNFIDYRDYEDTVLKSPGEFVKREAEDDMPGIFLDILKICGIERDIGWLSYYYVGDNKVFDKGITDAVTKKLGLETVKANTNAVRWVSQYTRNPAPSKIVWDLSTRAEEREKNTFYWLRAEKGVNQGIISASYDSESNTIRIETENVNGDFAIMFHPALIDVSRPVTIRTGETEYVVEVHLDPEYILESMKENGNPELACVGEILYSTVCQK